MSSSKSKTGVPIHYPPEDNESPYRLCYEIPYASIKDKIDEAREKKLKVTHIALPVRANIGDVYGVPAKLVLIEE